MAYWESGILFLLEEKATDRKRAERRSRRDRASQLEQTLRVFRVVSSPFSAPTINGVNSDGGEEVEIRRAVSYDDSRRPVVFILGRNGCPLTYKRPNSQITVMPQFSLTAIRLSLLERLRRKPGGHENHLNDREYVLNIRPYPSCRSSCVPQQCQHTFMTRHLHHLSWSVGLQAGPSTSFKNTFRLVAVHTPSIPRLVCPTSVQIRFFCDSCKVAAAGMAHLGPTKTEPRGSPRRPLLLYHHSLPYRAPFPGGLSSITTSVQSS